MTFSGAINCKRRPLAWLVAGGVFSLGASTAAIWQTAEGAEPSAEKAAQVVSKELGVAPAELTAATESLLPQLGIKRFKFIDSTGTVHGVDTDLAGNVVASTIVEEHVAQSERRGFVGKLERILAERMSRRVRGPIRVLILLRDSAASHSIRSLPGTEQQRIETQAVVRNQMAAIQQPLVSHLVQRGQAVVYASRYAPAIVASVDEQTLRQLEGRNDVEGVYLEKVRQPRLDVSRKVVQADVVQRRGISGSGVRVAVVEEGRIGRHTALPASQRTLCRGSASQVVNEHKTNVAGIIQSIDPVFRGIAPRVRLIDAISSDSSDAELMKATDCAIDQGAVAINMSFGSETGGTFDGFARYVDGIAHQAGVTVVVAVSNSCVSRMGSPEIAFNALAVGAFADRGTVTYTDDVHACNPLIDPAFSAFLDPLSPNRDREEPDVVAPGVDIATTIPDGGFLDTIGTSFAAPHVVGTVTLLANRRPELANENERVRAIVMASARHNIEGASRLSERDGAGAIMASAADRVLLDGQSWFKITPGGISGFPYTQTFRASEGERVRVVIVWSHKMPLGQNLTRPTTDLDLVVLRGSTVLGSSTSFDNTFEIVEFRAPATGIYTARIQNRRSSRGPEHIGLAVSRRSL